MGSEMCIRDRVSDQSSKLGVVHTTTIDATPINSATGADQRWPLVIGMVVLLGAFLIGVTNLRTTTSVTDPAVEPVKETSGLMPSL